MEVNVVITLSSQTSYLDPVKQMANMYVIDFINYSVVCTSLPVETAH